MTNSILTDKNVAEVFNSRAKNKKVKNYNITKKVYCRYSGLPLQVSNYLQGKHNIHFQTHWIFSQKPEIILDYLKSAKNFEDRLLTQLAALDAMDRIIFDAPMNITPTKIHSAHEIVIQIFTVYLHNNDLKRKAIKEFAPKYRISKVEENNSSNYQFFIQEIQNSMEDYLDISLAAFMTRVIGLDTSDSEFTKMFRKEAEMFRDNYKYSKKVGRQVLEGLKNHPDNTDLVEHFEKVCTFLLNDGYRKPTNLARVYEILQNCVIPLDEPMLERKVKLTMDYIKEEIETILDFESQFLGKRKFDTKSARISSDSMFSIVEDLESENDSNKIKIKKPVKLKLRIKS